MPSLVYLFVHMILLIFRGSVTFHRSNSSSTEKKKFILELVGLGILVLKFRELRQM